MYTATFCHGHFNHGYVKSPASGTANLQTLEGRFLKKAIRAVESDMMKMKTLEKP